MKSITLGAKESLLMKMKTEDYQKLEKAIQVVIKNTEHSLSEILEIYRKHKKSDEFIRWTLFHAANPGKSLPFRYLHDYLNDNHIDTALRKITGTK
jgi:hypothetical protein